MHKFIFIFFFIILFGNQLLFAQKNPDINQTADSLAISKSKINPLAPARAAFFSAIVPGLGQAYNKKYWKIPIVYAAIGTGIYFYSDNNKQYKTFRNAYKRRLAGYTDDEFYGQYSDQTLINAQRTTQRNRDLSLLVTVGLYVLNIVDANVDAHVLQFNVNNNLTLRPDVYQNDITYKQNVGLTLNYQF